MRRGGAALLAGVILYHGYTIHYTPRSFVFNWGIGRRVVDACPAQGRCLDLEGISVREAKQVIDWRIHWDRLTKQHGSQP